MNARFRKSLVRLVAGLATVTLITGQVGCAGFGPKEPSTPEPPPDWGRVGLASVAVEPSLEALGMPRTHSLVEDKAVQGGTAGAATGTAVGFAVCSPSVFFPPAYAICIAGLGLTGMAAGGGIGAVEQNKDDAEETFAAVRKGSAIQDVLRKKVMAIARHETSYAILDLGARPQPPAHPKTPSSVAPYGEPEPLEHAGRFDYLPFKHGFSQETGVDVVLEMILDKVLAQGLGGWKDEFEIRLTGRSRLIRVFDGRVLANRAHYYTGPAERIGASAAEQTDRVRRSIRIGIETLAHDIVTETLLGGGYGTHSGVSSLPDFMD